ncbi:MAG TPA: L-seryl-tRNA(Sec) selenium transferase, partial [Anaerolineaceae bacterium]|nr:L-seryl-tRNA(Sec) selenium transferase [Anaerolineaceae bacterium]
QGADLVSFSGDKLLGGPQAGILAGKKVLIDKIRKHPLYRALRPDKLCLAALSATLLHYLKGDYEQEIPLYRMLSQSEAQIKQRAQAWQAQLPNSQIIPGESTIGGGSLPGETLPTWLLQFKPKSANKLLNALRAGKPPIIARIQEQSVVLDPRTVQAEEELIIIQRLKEFLE